jgi:hypothetical protein
MGEFQVALEIRRWSWMSGVFPVTTRLQRRKAEDAVREKLADRTQQDGERAMSQEN